MLQKLQPTLEEVQQLFEEWRRNKKRRDRIPEKLWEAAISLSGQISAHRISKLLHLNHTAVRDRVREHKHGGMPPKKKGKNKKPAFIELGMVSPGTAASECIIEMERPGGAKMKICFKGNCPDIAGLSKAFLG